MPFFFNTITNQERVYFIKNLAIMLKAGIPINEVLGSLAGQAKSKVFKNSILEGKNKVEKGISLAEAFRKEEKIFGTVSIALIAAGEKSGTLEANLFFLADWLERDYDLKKQISSVTLYPKIVLAATLILGGGLAVFILPNLVPLFTSLRITLPLTTRILLAISIFLAEFWVFSLLGLIGFIFFFIFINRILVVKRFFQSIYLHIPFFSKLIIDYQLALIAQIFSTLFKSGVSLHEALDIIVSAPTLIHYQESIAKIKERVSQGITLSEAMGYYRNLYPDNCITIISTGEKSGTLDTSFLYLAEFYSKEVNIATKRLPTIIEPILLMVIGLIIGFVAISIIMPIYELTQGLSR